VSYQVTASTMLVARLLCVPTLDREYVACCCVNALLGVIKTVVVLLQVVSKLL